MSDSKGLGQRAFHVPTPQQVTQRQVCVSVVVVRAVAYLATHLPVSQSVVFAGANGKMRVDEAKGARCPKWYPPYIMSHAEIFCTFPAKRQLFHQNSMGKWSLAFVVGLFGK